MAFLKRLGFYLFGVSIGLVFLTIFLKKKSEEAGVSFCYLPNCRTLKDIRSKPMSYSESVSKLIEDKKIDTVTITHILTDGNVNFGESNTKSSPCKIYVVEGFLNDKDVIINVKNCPEKVVLENIDLN